MTGSAPLTLWDCSNIGLFAPPSVSRSVSGSVGKTSTDCSVGGSRQVVRPQLRRNTVRRRAVTWFTGRGRPGRRWRPFNARRQGHKRPHDALLTHPLLPVNLNDPEKPSMSSHVVADTSMQCSAHFVRAVRSCNPYRRDPDAALCVAGSDGGGSGRGLCVSVFERQLSSRLVAAQSAESSICLDGASTGEVLFRYLSPQSVPDLCEILARARRLGHHFDRKKLRKTHPVATAVSNDAADLWRLQSRLRAGIR